MVRTCVFRVAPSWGGGWYRTIEIQENQTLEDLHWAIQEALGWDGDHLYSFFMSGKAWDEGTEYALADHSEGGRICGDVRKTAIGSLGLQPKQRFLYLFDYGDNWKLGVQLLRVNKDAPRGERYPRVIGSSGRAPKQYSDWKG